MDGTTYFAETVNYAGKELTVCIHGRAMLICDQMVHSKPVLCRLNDNLSFLSTKELHD